MQRTSDNVMNVQIEETREKIQALNSEAFALRFTDFQRTLHLAEISLSLIGDSPDFLAEKASALNTKGIAHYTMGDDINAIDCFQESLRLARLGGDKGKEAAFLCSIGVVYLRRKETKTAILYFEESLSLCQTFGFLKTEAVVLNNLGNAFNDEKRFYDALACHEKSLSAKEKMNDERGKIASLGNLAFVYLELGDMNRAFQLLNQSRTIAEALGEKRSMANIYLNLGKLHAKHALIP
ncbi:MAG: tetratricopeptide repeat protein [Chlorobiales bacterium]